MTATIVLDAAGRFVLPKKMRDLMRLHAGSKLRADVVGDRILLEIEPSSLKLEKRGRRRVIVGLDGFDAAQAVREMRDEQVAMADAPFKK